MAVSKTKIPFPADAPAARFVTNAIELFDRHGGSELQLRHEQYKARLSERPAGLLQGEESCDRHNEGWNTVLDRLEKFVDK